MVKFEVVELQNNASKNDKLKRRVIRVKAKNNKQMTYDEIREYYDAITKKYNPNKVSISGMGQDKYLTMKGFDEDELKPWDDDDYYTDRAKDAEKFDKFFFVDFTFKPK